MQPFHSKPFCLIPKDLAGLATILHPIRSWTPVPKTIYDWIEFKLCWFNQIFLATLLLAVSIEAHTWNQLNDHYFDSQATKLPSMKEHQCSVWLIESNITDLSPELPESWRCFVILKAFPHWEDGTSELVDTPGLKIENNVLDVGGDTRGRGRRLVWCE